MLGRAVAEPDPDVYAMLVSPEPLAQLLGLYIAPAPRRALACAVRGIAAVHAIAATRRWRLDRLEGRSTDAASRTVEGERAGGPRARAPQRGEAPGRRPRLLGDVCACVATDG